MVAAKKTKNHPVELTPLFEIKCKNCKKGLDAEIYEEENKIFVVKVDPCDCEN